MLVHRAQNNTVFLTRPESYDLALEKLKEFHLRFLALSEPVKVYSDYLKYLDLLKHISYYLENSDTSIQQLFITTLEDYIDQLCKKIWREPVTQNNLNLSSSLIDLLPNIKSRARSVVIFLKILYSVLAHLYALLWENPTLKTRINYNLLFQAYTEAINDSLISAIVIQDFSALEKDISSKTQLLRTPNERNSANIPAYTNSQVQTLMIMACGFENNNALHTNVMLGLVYSVFTQNFSCYIDPSVLELNEFNVDLVLTLLEQNRFMSSAAKNYFMSLLEGWVDDGESVTKSFCKARLALVAAQEDPTSEHRKKYSIPLLNVLFLYAEILTQSSQENLSKVNALYAVNMENPYWSNAFKEKLLLDELKVVKSSISRVEKTVLIEVIRSYLHKFYKYLFSVKFNESKHDYKLKKEFTAASSLTKFYIMLVMHTCKAFLILLNDFEKQYPSKKNQLSAYMKQVALLERISTQIAKNIFSRKSEDEIKLLSIQDVNSVGEKTIKIANDAISFVSQMNYFTQLHTRFLYLRNLASVNHDSLSKKQFKLIIENLLFCGNVILECHNPNYTTPQSLNFICTEPFDSIFNQLLQKYITLDFIDSLEKAYSDSTDIQYDELVIKMVSIVLVCQFTHWFAESISFMDFTTIAVRLEKILAQCIIKKTYLLFDVSLAPNNLIAELKVVTDKNILLLESEPLSSKDDTVKLNELKDKYNKYLQQHHALASLINAYGQLLINQSNDDFSEKHTALICAIAKFKNSLYIAIHNIESRIEDLKISRIQEKSTPKKKAKKKKKQKKSPNLTNESVDKTRKVSVAKQELVEEVQEEVVEGAQEEVVEEVQEEVVEEVQEEVVEEVQEEVVEEAQEEVVEEVQEEVIEEVQEEVVEEVQEEVIEEVQEEVIEEVLEEVVEDAQEEVVEDTREEIDLQNIIESTSPEVESITSSAKIISELDKVVTPEVVNEKKYFKSERFMIDPKLYRLLTELSYENDPASAAGLKKIGDMMIVGSTNAGIIQNASCFSDIDLVGNIHPEILRKRFVVVDYSAYIGPHNYKIHIGDQVLDYKYVPYGDLISFKERDFTISSTFCEMDPEEDNMCTIYDPTGYGIDHARQKHFDLTQNVNGLAYFQSCPLSAIRALGLIAQGYQASANILEALHSKKLVSIFNDSEKISNNIWLRLQSRVNKQLNNPAININDYFYTFNYFGFLSVLLPLKLSYENILKILNNNFILWKIDELNQRKFTQNLHLHLKYIIAMFVAVVLVDSNSKVDDFSNLLPEYVYKQANNADSVFQFKKITQDYILQYQSFRSQYVLSTVARQHHTREKNLYPNKK